MKFFLFESFYSFLENQTLSMFVFSFFLSSFLRNISSSFLFSFSSFFVRTSKRNPLLVVSHCFSRQRVAGKGEFSKEGWEILTSKTYFRGIHGFGSAHYNEICPVRLYYESRLSSPCKQCNEPLQFLTCHSRGTFEIFALA